MVLALLPAQSPKVEEVSERRQVSVEPYKGHFMRLPRFSVVWVMAFIALAVLSLGAIRAWLSLRTGHGVGVSGQQVKYIDNTFDLLGYGGLPMADLLAGGLLAGLAHPRFRPFWLGFELFGTMAMVVFAVSATLYTEGMIQPRILSVLRSLPRRIYGLSPAVRTSALYAVSATLVVLPQLAVALIGGFVFHAVSRGTPRPSTT